MTTSCPHSFPLSLANSVPLLPLQSLETSFSMRFSCILDECGDFDACDECGKTFQQHEPRYRLSVLQHNQWAERRFCGPCWLADLVHVHEYGLDGCLQHEAMVHRVQIVPGYLGRWWEKGTLFRTIMCADGGVYRNEQTGLEIITMQRVKMRTCYNYLCHTRHELNRMADAESLSTNMYDPIAC